jgi:homoserine O-succinyltransferase/O-acetyltransferase
VPLTARRPGASPAEAAPALSDRAPRLTVAFVNNMPDGAFNATERQFFGLLEAGSGALGVEVRSYTMDGVPRGERVAARIAENYFPLDTLWESTPDAVIVTGSNPLASRLRQEPYWEDLARVITSFVGRTTSVLLSCLSAHAALDLLDGIPRGSLPSKCTGVFAQELPSGYPLTGGLPAPLVLPHSRLNDVEEEAVRAAGYDVVLGSKAVGWSVVSKQVGATQLVLVQGHPEYDPSSLIREYRRDVGRYVDGTRLEPPCLPVNCVAAADRPALDHLHREVLAGRAGPGEVAAFPFDQMAERADWPWRPLATKLYANWLEGVHQGTLKRSD